jgi:hypothetical protein
VIFKTGGKASRRRVGIPRGRLPDEALSLVEILDLGVTTIRASSATVPVGWLFQKLFRARSRLRGGHPFDLPEADFWTARGVLKGARSLFRLPTTHEGTDRTPAVVSEMIP